MERPDKRSEPGREALERLLALLDPEPAKAAREFAKLRQRLTRLFEWRGCRFPEDLVDETISRVARRLDEGVEIHSDDPYRYFCGVAHMVFKEVLRERRRERNLQDPASWPPAPEPSEPDDDPRMEILQSCLAKLSEQQRRLLLDYHQGDGRDRIENRRKIAQRLDVPLNALRIRVHRIRAKLEGCVHEQISGSNERLS